jgi:hypothetical protein
MFFRRFLKDRKKFTTKAKFQDKNKERFARTQYTGTPSTCFATEFRDGRWKFYRVETIVVLYTTSWFTDSEWEECKPTVEHWILARGAAKEATNFLHLHIANIPLVHKVPFTCSLLPVNLWKIVIEMLLDVNAIRNSKP